MPSGTKKKTKKKEKKTLIAVLASHDNVQVNNSLARVFEELHEENPNLLQNFHFVFTGGTFKRLLGKPKDKGLQPVRSPAKEVVRHVTTCLPPREQGGVTLLSYLIVRHRCSAIWPFYTPLTGHWLTPENLALMRLCDLWHVKRLMNAGSVREWFRREADHDVDRNRQKCPPSFFLGDEKKPASQSIDQTHCQDRTSQICSPDQRCLHKC